MNEKVKKALAEAMEYDSMEDINDKNISDILEFLSCCNEKSSEIIGECRWWDIVEYVVEFNGIFLKYHKAKSTGDLTPNELGYEGISSIDEIVEVHPKTIQTTIYI